ncbi:hypothetical protein [Gilvimarinus xylanilyticus]|uniref:Uncharacterized protein n=1 Tax=Gilvimarinus xylanilyticus TaxID=2944139 RepID=A0A9X2I7Y7_9GAMM|nr:hypothetical protein [Gilvimarinus xylanilyticus]MCP8900452.1 hypothetical protein [Gilvimarinus xylanilyticus]
MKLPHLSNTNLYSLQNPVSNRVQASEPVQQSERARPVNQPESARKGESKESLVPLEGELLEAGLFDPDTLDIAVQQLLQRGRDEGGEGSAAERELYRELNIVERGASAEPSANNPPNNPPDTPPNNPSNNGRFAFTDLRSALDYWESLKPEHTAPEDLPAPIAAYRAVESGPTLRLGLSAYA